MNILLVDDNQTMRQRGRETLSLLGMNVDTSINGAQAIDMCSANNYEIVFLDIRMPGIDGHQTFEGLKNCGFSGHIVALSADPTQSKKCLSRGFDFFLEKPYSFDEIEKILSSYQ